MSRNTSRFHGLVLSDVAKRPATKTDSDKRIMNFDTPIERGKQGTSLVRAMNMQAVLDAVVQSANISRPEVAEQTGLSLPTTNSLVTDLERLGLVNAVGQATGAKGRPATRYSMNARAGYIFGVDIGRDRVTAGIADLFGDILLERCQDTTGDSAESLIAQVKSLHSELRSGAGFKPSDPGFGCMGVPGVWHPETDFITDATNLPALGNFEVQKALTSALQIPVEIENDVNLASIGERWRGRAKECDNFVTISVGTGIGMGIVIDGEIYRGKNGAAGEIALLPVGPDPYQTSLREHGPFQTATSIPSLLARVADGITSGASTKLSGGCTLADVLNAAESNDALAVQVLEDEARMLALGIASAIAILDPELLVLGGIGESGVLIEAISQRVAALLPTPAQLVTSSLGSRATFYGAVAVGLNSSRNHLLTSARNQSKH